ncbi:Hypothetical protein NGK_0819 [Neisseria gonorrhoeae NCCP11945]|uniref:Uncharacterized protein n=1 Tax=Neisseria gonorrhoeae (strain NCCP11945) TaxID=521006 RepID=B4RL09_NEIG2|nr:Hypothetical protein NGK_0819 [Neisseria gonorrhoeae NCCP11945]
MVARPIFQFNGKTPALQPCFRFVVGKKDEKAYMPSRLVMNTEIMHKFPTRLFSDGIN